MSEMARRLETVAVRWANVMPAVESVLAGLALYLMQCIAK